ncbi:MAG: hypothetical protein ACOYOP_07095 [Microthrixaceae bacterium]
MAEIVLVHGAFHELWGPTRLGMRWAPSLMDGMWAAGVDVRGVPLDRIRSALTVAFWGDLFRPAPLPLDELTARLQEGDEGASLEGIDLTEAAQALGGGGGLHGLSAAIAKETQQRSMELLGRYFLEPEMRDRVHERVHRVLGEDTRVVVAHSMGTVIAYQALCSRDDLRIDQFVTLGSPLGTELVLGQLSPAPLDGTGPWPACVAHWTNVAAEGDLATMGAPRLAEAFGSEVRDEYVFNGRHPHDIEPYLTAAETGRAVASGLGLLSR